VPVWICATWGAGNNGAVSTAMASSFLNCPGGAVARGWSLASPERVAGVAGPVPGHVGFATAFPAITGRCLPGPVRRW